MKTLVHTFKTSLGALFASTFLSAPALAGVIILDFGADNDVAHLPYGETIEAGDPTPFAVVGTRPDVADPFDIGPIALTDGATISWTNVTAWNNDSAAGSAGQNYFANKPGNTTNFTITTANPGDTVLVEAVAGFSRDALVSYGGGAAVDVNTYTSGVTGWSTIGSSVGSSTGNLAVSDSGDEGNVGAFRVTITPVPEPATSVLFGLASLALAIRRRR
ncbi:PEP-CTERM sorting domain-containing protein [Akkermansiaceae bacterium]|nr:PEP-CTERM sorting domain-containing protein [Akkermansiaceae bacterium]